MGVIVLHLFLKWQCILSAYFERAILIKTLMWSSLCLVHLKFIFIYFLQNLLEGGQFQKELPFNVGFAYSFYLFKQYTMICFYPYWIITMQNDLAWRTPGTGGAWWAAVCGVAQSQIRLKRLSSIAIKCIFCGIVKTLHHKWNCFYFGVLKP